MYYLFAMGLLDETRSLPQAKLVIVAFDFGVLTTLLALLGLQLIVELTLSLQVLQALHVLQLFAHYVHEHFLFAIGFAQVSFHTFVVCLEFVVAAAAKLVGIGCCCCGTY